MIVFRETRRKSSLTNITRIVQSSLLEARHDSRVVIGFTAAIERLANSPDNIQFCYLALPDDGDSATHMNEVLLEAYCYEHGIYIIKVDSTRKLSKLMGLASEIQPCVLVERAPPSLNSIFNIDPEYCLFEETCDNDTSLVDYCEKYWDYPTTQPIIQLPES